MTMAFSLPSERFGPVYQSTVSVTRGLSVFTPFGRSDVRVVLGIPLDRLIAAVGTDRKTHVVAFHHQAAHRFVWETRLEIDPAAPGHRLGLTFGRGRTFVLDARRVAGFLQVHAEIDQVHHDLDVALRLHVAAHHTEADPRLAVLRDEGRNDRVERTLAGLERVRVTFFQYEELAAILKDEAESGRRHARSHAAIVRLD